MRKVYQPVNFVENRVDTPEVVGNPNQPESDMYILRSQMVALEIENLKLKSRLDAIENVLIEIVKNAEFVEDV